MLKKLINKLFKKEDELTDEEILAKLKEAEEEMAGLNRTYTAEEVHKMAEKIINSKN